MKKPIGETLIELGLLDSDGLDRALKAQHEHGERLGQILTKLGLISDRDRAQALSIQLALPLVDGADYPAKPIFVGKVSSSFLKESKVVPLRETEEDLILAMADPLDEYVVEAMELVANKKIRPSVGAQQDIEFALERLYNDRHNAFDEIVEDIGVRQSTVGDDVERLKDMASEAPVIRLVNHVINRALDARASDIHIEPFESELVVRYRIDGILREVDSSPAHLAPAVVSRVKIMANLNIAERRLPQDGRVRLRVQGKELDLRISTVPSIHGESVTIRLLEHNPVALHMNTLGLDPRTAERFSTALDQHHGVLLVTGPTGSGKTTTLYAALNDLNTRERKIITIEDPVEYQLHGITQIHVNPRIDLTFANVLRSIVRQDPDIIMIGEMRDVETAEIAVQSALTGHLVLSTLHTNNAPGAITRLLDMGATPH
jgi:general secretion pathway protein E